MHADVATPLTQARETKGLASGEGLDFLWLELTNRCNLQCVHCYTESSPHSTDRDILTGDDYDRIMVDAFALGCRKVQFIGGEPTLNVDFDRLLRRSVDLGYTYIEVYTNLTRLDEETIRFSAANGVCYATSVYSTDPAEHDAVTKVRGSHTRTMRNLQRLLDAGIKVRAGVIAMGQDRASLERTKEHLKALGVSHVSSGPIREFGRAEQVMQQEASLSGLCGHCWAGKLAVAPDGAAYSCVMARNWPVGHVLEQSLASIVEGEPLRELRRTIYEDVWVKRTMSAGGKASGGKASGGKASGGKASGGKASSGGGGKKGGDDADEPPQACDPDHEVEACDPDEKPAGDVRVLCEPDDCSQSPCEPELCSQSCSPICAQSCDPTH